MQIPGAGTVVVIADGSALDRVARTGAPARMATDDPDVPAGAPRAADRTRRDVARRGADRRRRARSGARSSSRSRAIWSSRRMPRSGSGSSPGSSPSQSRTRKHARSSQPSPTSRPPSAALPSPSRPRSSRSGSSTPFRRRSAGSSARDAAATVRYVDDPAAAEIVGGWERDGHFDAPLGVRLPFEGGAIARVAQTGRTARIDLETEPPDLQERMVAAGVSCGVAAPIVVSGRLWGATSISISGARAVSTRRRDPPREVHEPRRGRTRERRGPRAADRVAGAHRPGRATPSGGGSSATSTTARSSASSPSRSTFASPSHGWPKNLRQLRS